MTSKYFSGAPYGPKNTVVNCVAPHGLMQGRSTYIVKRILNIFINKCMFCISVIGRLF